jgi:hypothetical protein
VSRSLDGSGILREFLDTHCLAARDHWVSTNWRVGRAVKEGTEGTEFFVDIASTIDILY